MVSLKERFSLLDCTLRDGGFANNFEFGYENIKTIAQNLSDANVNVIELGFLEADSKKDSNLSTYPTLEDLAKVIPSKRKNGQFYSGMITYPAFPIENVSKRVDAYCDVIRVIIRYSELQESLDFCRKIADRGYTVFIQAAITMRYSMEELQKIFDMANEIRVYAVYIVDTYGYMHEQDVIHYFKIFDASLDDAIRVGFHAHNNINLSFANTIAFLNYSSNRKIIVDSCLLGMGQGAGNLQTELFVDYFNKKYGLTFQYEPILNACETVEKYWGKTAWGYSMVDLLAAINKTSYKYSRVLRSEYGLSFVQINRLLSNIPEELRHRYTPENTKRLLAML